jgi:broad specificity phosphatase PhoE
MDEVLFGRVVDAPLDANGQRQADTLAEELVKRFELSFLAVSPRLRTRQTAAALEGRLRCASGTTGDFDEIDFGRWSSLSFAELESDPDWRAWNSQRDTARTPAGDTIVAVQDRALSAMRALRGRFPGRSVGIVSHSEVIRSIALRCLDLPSAHYVRLRIDPASVSVIDMQDELMRVESLNERLV